MSELLASVSDEQVLDWNDLWRKAAARKWPRLGDRSQYWNRRAPSFSTRSLASPYTKAFIEILAPRRHWSVLDVGCGTGTLAIPLAGLVQKVTAMDFSEAMIEHLIQGFSERGISNILPLHGGWEDDWDALGIGTHDVAIASRSLVVADLEGAIRKLNRAARRRVYITSPAGDGSMDRRTMEAVGRPFQKGPDYIYVYNLLHQLGIYANVTILKTEEERTFRDPEDALEVYRALIEDLTSDEDARLRSYISQEVVQTNGKWALRGKTPHQWALIWWEKGEA